MLVANRNQNEIVKVNSQGELNVIARNLKTPVGVVEASDGTLFVTNFNGGIAKINLDGDVIAYSDEFVQPGVGIAFDQTERLFATDYGNGSVRIIREDGTTEEIIKAQGAAVALLIEGQLLYVSSWGQRTVTVYRLLS